jgi:sugar/nucleoside kinase (ribokinase family)
MDLERHGIAAAGNWIIDHIYICDCWPQEEALANILEEGRGTGGGPIPLEAIGLVGSDTAGEFIRHSMAGLGVDTSALAATTAAPTSHTLVCVAKPTGRRTFFHNRGANDHFDPASVPVEKISARLVHIGYLLLLDRFDEPDPEYGTAAARLLARLQAAGIETSIDVVSEDSRRFPQIVKPALKHADYAILNEFEAGRTTGHDLRPDQRPDPKAIRASARELLRLGVKRLVCIHMPEGGYALTADGKEYWQPSLALPEGYIRGGAGAGDAFCAGVLYGLHERWEMERSLRLGVCAAAVCLSDPTCTAAACSLAETVKLAEKYPYRPSAF